VPAPDKLQFGVCQQEDMYDTNEPGIMTRLLSFINLLEYNVAYGPDYDRLLLPC
jgi:hypothetical protein